MKFSKFKTLDPDLARRLIDNAEAVKEISDWQQQLRDRLVSALKKKGFDGLVPVYHDDIRTEYMTLLEQAEAVGDPAMLRIVAHLKDERRAFERAWQERDQIYDDILKKHGLEVGVVVGGDGGLEDGFEFTEQQ